MKRASAVDLAVLGGFLIACLTHCGSSEGSASESGNGAGAAGAGAAGGGMSGTGSSTGAGADAGIIAFDVMIGDGTIHPNGDGAAEVCDGVDNDENGIVDDVDVGGDGVCDCLNIATIGEIGPHSNGGNIFAAWLNSRSPRPAVALADGVITDTLLNGLDVIVVLYSATMELQAGGRILAPHHAFNQAEADALSRWVQQGGGVMTTIGYTEDEATEVVNINTLLSPLGLGYSSTKLDLTGFIENWVQHPVTDGVKNIYTDNGVEPDDALGTTLALDSYNRVALKVKQIGTGKAVIWGDEWITYDSQWTDLADQQVERFWLNILKWLSPERKCQVPLPPVK